MERLLAQLKALPPWQRHVLLLGIPIALILYLWFMLISPAGEEVDRLRGDVNREKTEVERLRASIKPSVLENLRKEEEKLNEEYSRKYTELTALVGEIPTQKDISLVLRSIGKVARSSGVKLLGMQIGTPQQASYQLAEEGGKKLIKEITVQQGQQGGQQQTQQQTKQQPKQAQQQEGVKFLRSELKLSFSGNYKQVSNFINTLKKEGVISYPVSMSLTNEGKELKGELVIYLIMKEGDRL